jgi:uncharacterized protein (TIGR03083 family)
MDTWQMIKAERASLADDLAALPDASWDRDSLCNGWTVRDTVSHVIAATYNSPLVFFRKLIANGFRFNQLSNRDIKAVSAGKSTTELVDLLRSRVDARAAPPGPRTTLLGEVVIHGEDVFRALGRYRDHPAEHLIAVADLYKNNFILVNSRKRIAGLSLHATDTDWSTGSGPEVRGPTIALILAMTGRTAAYDDVTGEGVDILRQRP